MLLRGFKLGQRAQIRNVQNTNVLQLEKYKKLLVEYMANIKGAFITPIFKKKLRDVIKIACGGTALFIGFGVYSNNEKFYKSLVMPAIHTLDPEDAHKLGIFLTKYKAVPNVKLNNSEFLESTVLGVKFANPIGVAAGYDKNGEAVEGLFKMGFGYVEVGSITPRPQPGNPKPRVFRLQNINGIINRYGFNSDGHDVVFERLSKLAPPGKRKGALGINLGKNKESEDATNDYVLGVRKFGPIADYLVINVSSPNTPGLRNLQRKNELENLTAAVIDARNNLFGEHKPPIFLKISPDLSLQDKKDIVSVITRSKHRVDGLIISNTTISRPIEECEHIDEEGGLSGKPLKTLSNVTLREMAQLTEGKIPIIGVGGVFSGKDAQEKIYNGANLIQIYSSLTFDGPPILKRILTDLENLLRKDGYNSLSSAVGANLKKM